ncbi:uracil-DNA glycosylase [Aquabacterium commune]|uniref:Uracil-DNA glycosylase n=1 Tax=Aquabacterium commune TaxID=70586 RepID=A0A4R6RHN0_9BURK|nr:uracil-DNA glycosylase family protein [Aquabacterium commune]TDP85832.1 uracil-DNA glycosylase [Aquabacterium commune]
MAQGVNPADLLAQVRACTLCALHLPLGPRPVLQHHPDARILIAGQAPGRKVHASGVPFDDASGERLRAWLGLGKEAFYDPRQVAILPMGFCFPGTGKSGDLPPRPECAVTWRVPLLAGLHSLRLTLVLGQHAQAWHLPTPAGEAAQGVTAQVQAWRERLQGPGPHTLPLPHPSPRNNLWLQRNPWFTQDVLPALQARVKAALA